jgi:chromosome segregation ATPase
VEILILSVISLFGRQWSQWEILTISLATLFVLVWMTKQQRSKKVRSNYNKDQFLDSSPLIGLKFGANKKSRHIVEDSKKDRLAPVHKHQNKQHIQTKEPLEKPHEENKQLQNENIEHKQTKVSFEQQVSELTANNEKLQCELAKLEQAESQNEQHLQTKEFLEKLQEEIKLLQNETFNHKQAKIRFEQQVTELTTHNEKLQRELDKSKQAESQNKQHLQTLEKLHEEIKQLQNEITEHKQAKGRFEQQVSELTAENEKLRCELDKFEQVESQIAEMTAACQLLQPEDSQVGRKSEQQVVAEPVVEEPVKRKTARRSKTCEQQHRTVDGVRQKLCRKCKEWKPESEFHKNSSSKDGLAGSCKICKNNEAKKQRRRRQTVQK